MWILSISTPFRIKPADPILILGEGQINQKVNGLFRNTQNILRLISSNVKVILVFIAIQMMTHEIFGQFFQSEQLVIPDRLVKETYLKAANQNILAAIDTTLFYGYFSVCADGKGYGRGNSFPSLDGHQMSAALAWLGQLDIIKANWDYVKSFQKPDGQLPLAIIPKSAGQMIGAVDLKSLVDSNGGFYNHWVPGNPLRALAPCTYIQNADLIYRFTQDKTWLKTNIRSINLAGEYLMRMVTDDGLVAGAGYYLERPLRFEYDGVTQCHTTDALNLLAGLNDRLDDSTHSARFKNMASKIKKQFQISFWNKDRFVEYIHPTKGKITNHGYTDVDWSALAFDMATPEQINKVWPRIKKNKKFYLHHMPTGISTKPHTYEKWESSYSDMQDLAAMGRVWYIEAQARYRMQDARGLIKGIKAVSRMGRDSGYFWRERYNKEGGYGVEKYNEYPANLIRIVQQYLMGVQIHQDGSISIRPLVPRSYWRQGFGQIINSTGFKLQYFMRKKNFQSQYTGANGHILRIKCTRYINQDNSILELNGIRAPIVCEKGELLIRVPPSSPNNPTRIKIYPK